MLAREIQIQITSAVHGYLDASEEAGLDGALDCVRETLGRPLTAEEEQHARGIFALEAIGSVGR